ncbi:hypothetical protein AAFF_G00048970 [Aldrovandia affinis]|uniref:Uncharacterized protein n=1 Tax=Aldrovandia affinis TaxID=143900 RepID=A0AAD7WEJ6_9TELE|nr:hypothetical protein AAFF_G00048970 [Aldrovandia affinis]
MQYRVKPRRPKRATEETRDGRSAPNPPTPGRSPTLSTVKDHTLEGSHPIRRYERPTGPTAVAISSARSGVAPGDGGPRFIVQGEPCRNQPRFQQRYGGPGNAQLSPFPPAPHRGDGSPVTPALPHHALAKNATLPAHRSADVLFQLEANGPLRDGCSSQLNEAS